jgi:hypothetical protein
VDTELTIEEQCQWVEQRLEDLALWGETEGAQVEEYRAFLAQHN